ncbi:hypothetical protein AVEN_162574-1 [Araneus ventricosus]|uniref:Uncharacterized protein n=1 Tax=Araneus ventricosus TaxID=182803 RepID=A0A4Y2MJE3_ARAVE|nr:hypothetical protein AVEN_162574-1 [Araneus ventricosus]
MFYRQTQERPFFTLEESVSNGGLSRDRVLCGALLSIPGEVIGPSSRKLSEEEEKEIISPLPKAWRSLASRGERRWQETRFSQRPILTVLEYSVQRRAGEKHTHIQNSRGRARGQRD